MTCHRGAAVRVRSAPSVATLALLASVACARDVRPPAARADTMAELTLAPAHDAEREPIVGSDSALHATLVSVPSARNVIVRPRATSTNRSSTRSTEFADADARTPRTQALTGRRAAARPDSGGAAAPAAPAVPPPSAAPVLAAGRTVALVLAPRACGADLGVGARLGAALQESVTGEDGTTLPAGSEVALVVSAADAGQVRVAATTLFVGEHAYPLEGTVGALVLDTVRVAEKRRGILGGIGGALAGAALGVATGHSAKAAVIGAAAGGTAGAVAGTATTPGSVCVAPGQRLALHVTRAFRMLSP